MKKELKRKARPPGRADPSGKRRTGGTRKSGEKGKRKNALPFCRTLEHSRLEHSKKAPDWMGI